VLPFDGDATVYPEVNEMHDSDPLDLSLVHGAIARGECKVLGLVG